MQFVIITGMSGAGKSTVLKYFEDMGFFCVDNLPPVFLPKFVEVCARAGTEIQRAAFGIDIRGGNLFDDLFQVLHELNTENFNYSVLFLECSDEVLLKRYKESRRSHPLAKNDRIITGIEKERELLSAVKKQANYIIDTSYFLARQLKEKLNEIYVEYKSFSNLMITILSFGFKYGIPEDSDLLFDVRFLPNPYYTELRELTGNDLAVKEYVLNSELSHIFLDKLLGMLEFLIPHYIEEGKSQLVLSIGCTGGKHRSVTLANEVFAHLQNKGHSVLLNHRDIERDLLH